MGKKAIIPFIIALIFISFLYFYFLSKPKYKKLVIGDKEILVEIADTWAKRTRGLSQRNFLPENQGMLFLYKEPGFYAFSMREMKFPLDFIWILGDEVVEITEKIKPEDYQPPKSLLPKEKVDKVLEVNAGFVEKFQIKVGDKIILK